MVNISFNAILNFMKSGKFLLWWGPVFIWTGVIYTLSALPTVETSKIYWWDFVLKKSAHVFEYAVLYFLLFRAINKIEVKLKKAKLTFLIKNGQLIRTKNFLLPLLLAFLYALSDEYHQRFTPGRHAKLRDVGFDLLGMVLISWFILKQLMIKNEAKTS